jgi:hypothetical protein
MKLTDSSPSSQNDDDLAVEYTFDYTKAKPNRFVTQDSSSKITVIVLDEDIARFFPTSEAVNKALRHLIKTVS